MSVLVAYGSSGESDQETEDVAEKPGEISDDDEANPTRSIVDDDDTSPSGAGLALPIPGSRTAGVPGLVDENEDMSTIPAHKMYAKEEAVVAPKKRRKESVWSTKARASKRRGPIRIMAPSIVADSDEEAEERRPAAAAAKAVSKPTSSSSGGFNPTHSLFDVLPDPKGAPQPTPKPSLVPRSVSRRKIQKEEEDDDVDVPFFNFDQPRSSGTKTKKRPLVVNAKPDVAAGPSSSEPVWGPEPAPTTAVPGYDDANDLMSNREAMERLQGRQKDKARMREELANVVEVDASELTADPREWMTKALTEEQEAAPGPRCTVKGQTKRKHQITYLAALAKEKEQELKQQWASNANSRRQAANKYGF